MAGAISKAQEGTNDGRRRMKDGELSTNLFLIKTYGLYDRKIGKMKRNLQQEL